MVSDNFGPDDYGGSNFSRFIRKCNNFRSTPAAVLAVSTMAVFADTMVYGLIVPFLPEILQERLHMSSSTNGVLFGCFGIGVLVGAPISAYISDRWKLRKWPMIIGLLGLGATSVLFAFSNAFWELVVARLAQGVSSGITWAVGLGMIADVYAGEAIGQAMGVAFSGFTLGYLGGPVLGGVIYGAGGTHAIAIFVGAIAAVDLVCRLLLKEPHEVLSACASHAKTSSNPDVFQREKLLESSSPSDGNSNTNRPKSTRCVSLPAPVLISSPAVAGSLSGVAGIASTEGENTCNANDIAHDTITRISGIAEIDAASQNTPEAEQGDDDKKTDRFSVDKCKSADPSKNRRTTMLDLLKEWPILACCLATITVTGASGAFEPTLPIHLAEKYNSSSTVIGVVFIALVIPNAVIAPFAGKYTDDSRVLAKLAPYGRFGFMIIGSILEAIAIACIGATTNIAGIVVNLVFVGLLGGIAAVPVMSAMGIHVHRMGGDAYAKVYALFNIAYSIGVIIIPTVLPPIMNAVGFAATMGVTAAILVFGAIILAIQPTLMLIKHGRAAYLGENGRVFL
ncbi:hypothetical protein GGI25_006372 [Coemansia spiralis]|uniref:Major facilitator superfamily (MFS) profile domain-containing protein n=2 Tax=Coemansia TaxID=4863 RepID=A0A9W8G2V8_9FUNG|nr:hypothetical protein GGI26_003633 [Coemansia sp. RSA 1358]KAJ2668724.1 hypothetical protein GGI25_006372 [Coemansia spiralis]